MDIFISSIACSHILYDMHCLFKHRVQSTSQFNSHSPADCWRPQLQPLPQHLDTAIRKYPSVKQRFILLSLELVKTSVALYRVDWFPLSCPCPSHHVVDLVDQVDLRLAHYPSSSPETLPPAKTWS